MNILELFNKGREALKAASAAQEAQKLGILRAGNTGLVAMDGKVIGKCARLTYLRYAGIAADDIDDNRELMFEGGRSNEDIWIDVLKAANATDLIFLREEEIPINWSTRNGTPVSGRPDIVVAQVSDQSGQAPTLLKGIELKQVCSIWTARDVVFGMKPKMAHLLQAAHYSWRLEIPFELWYTSRTDFAIGSGWEQKQFPSGHPLIDYNKDGKKKKVKPFMQGYELAFTEQGQLKYRSINTADVAWTHTIITKDGIERYYNMVADMQDLNTLPPPPDNLDADGSRGNFSLCDYCPLGPACCGKDKESKTLIEWKEKVLKFLAERADK